MIKRAVEEIDSSQTSADTNSLSESIERLDLSSQSSASAVFGTTSTGAAGDESGNSKRSSSPSPRHVSHDSSGSTGRAASPSGFHLPSFRHHKRTASQRSSAEKKECEKHDGHLSRWLSSGNVIYKSVGLGLMDLVVGFELIKLAKTRGVGTRVDNFST